MNDSVFPFFLVLLFIFFLIYLYWSSSLLFFPISFVYWYVELYSSFSVIFPNLNCIIHPIKCFCGMPVTGLLTGLFILKFLSVGI